MADSGIQVPPDSSGKIVDTEELTTLEGLVERQRVQVGGRIAAAIAAVADSLPSPDDYALVTRDAPANFSSGLVQGAGALTDVANIGETDPCRLDGLHLVNNGAAQVDVTVTDGAGAAIVPTMGLPAKGFLPITFNGMPIVGLKLNAPATVTLRAWGRV